MLAADLGLALHPRARAVLFPALGAYVGGDIVAGMLATGMDRDKRTRLFIDVGTNCEIVLSDGDRILSTAAPAGPAFEGGAIRCGMRAADGAIEVVKLDPDGGRRRRARRDRRRRAAGAVRLRARRRGRRAGAGSGCSTRSGRFVPEEVAEELAPGLADRLTKIGEERVFVLHRPDAATPTPPTASASPSATSASCSSPRPRSPPAGRCCSRSSASSTATSSRCCSPGSFGSYLSAASAVRIGLVPKLPVLRIVAAGNVAGEGAKMALLSMRERAGRAGAAGGGDLCRALRPPRLQRPVRRPARLPLATRVALIACGAIAQPAAEIVERRGWPVDVHPLPPLLHNQPQLIAGEVRGLATELRRAVRHGRGGVRRLRHLRRPRRGLRASSGCAGCRGCTATTCSPAQSRLETFFDEQPGTYLLTDFLVRSFARTVVRELGLDR